MLRSLKRLSELEGDYKVFPGHEGISTLSEERARKSLYVAGERPMKYILEGHEMKHAAEMLLHLLPTETLTRVETEQDGDICISALTEQDGCLCAAARVTIGGETHAREHSCPDGGSG